MNLPSASYVSRCGKPSRSWSNPSDKVPSHVAKNYGHQQSNRNPSPEIKSEDMASVYSDAGDTFASRPSNAACEDHLDAVSAGLYVNAQVCTDSDSRDFILKRFLPAAQAMAATGVKSSTSSLPPENRLQKSSRVVPTARLGSFASGSSKSKNRFIQEVKQDVRGEDLNDEGEEMIKACGFPLHLGRMTLQNFRYNFWTSRSSSRSKLHQSTTKIFKKAIQEEESDNSDDLFWSDEEGFDDAMSHAPPGGVGMNEGGERNSSQMRKRLAAEILPLPTRLHSMETVHTPDHRGFLGVPKTTKLTSGEMERARQVDRLGARLTRMLSKTNYMESRNATRINEHDEVELAAGSSQGPSATTSSSSVEAPVPKWVDAVASLIPPPSPKMPSESWLSNTLPPERFMEVKKLSRKSLGSFIPIKPPLKSTSTERQHPHREEVSFRLRQSCSLKEHLQGRQVLRSSTMQTV